MLVFQSSKEQSLISVFTAAIFALLLLPSLVGYHTLRTTNTDTFSSTTGSALTAIAAPEKTEIEEIEEIAVPKLGAVTSSGNTATVQQTAMVNNVAACANHVSAPVNAIAICGRTIPLRLSAQKINGATPPAGVAVQNTFYNVIYGHNSADVFGGLYGALRPGNQFAVNIAGRTTVYAVASIYNITTDDQFNKAAGTFRYGANSSLAVITCAPGVTYNVATGGTSSSERTLVIANPQ